MAKKYLDYQHMSNKKVNKMVPKLRFPEFKYSDVWEEKKIGEIAIVNPPVQELPESFVYIDLESVEDGVLLKKNIITKESAPSRAQRLLKSDDVIFQMVRPYQKNNYLFKRVDNFEYVASTGYAQLRPNESSEFLYQSLHNQWFVDKVLEKCTGSNYPAINSSDFSAITIAIPKLNEQKKIASCLSSLDDLITVETERLDTLKAHKKGLTQNLFPQEGENIPRIQFRELKNTGKWEEKILGDIAEFLKGKGISRSDITLAGILPCIRYGELYTHYNETINTVVSYTNQPSENLILSRVNDVLIPSSGETKEDIATASCIMKSGVAIGGDLNIIRSKINGVFLSYYLNNVKKKDISKLAQGDAVVHLYNKQLQKLSVNIPNLKEQQKIADCLSSLDEWIAAQSEKIDLLKLHKKSLMQQLFPSTNELPL